MAQRQLKLSWVHCNIQFEISFRLNWLKRDSKFSSKTCYGADPDRNYNIEWQKHESPSACSDYYEGPKAFSEPETKALAGFLDENRHYINVREFFSIYPNFLFVCSNAFHWNDVSLMGLFADGVYTHTSHKNAQTNSLVISDKNV